MYHDKVGFVERVCEEEIYVRTSGELRTQVVAGAMLYGMDPKTAGMNWGVHTQPANVRMVLIEVSSVAVLSIDCACVCVCTCTD